MGSSAVIGETGHSVTSRNSALDNSQVGLLAGGSQRLLKPSSRLPTFPGSSAEWFLGAASHSQWRDRAGFTPDFPVMPHGHLRV